MAQQGAIPGGCLVDHGADVAAPVSSRLPRTVIGNGRPTDPIGPRP
jgi:hypothetical protein